jgi:hypothetical protein
VAPIGSMMGPAMDVDPRAAAAKRKREKERLQVLGPGGGAGQAGAGRRGSFVFARGWGGVGGEGLLSSLGWRTRRRRGIVRRAGELELRRPLPPLTVSLCPLCDCGSFFRFLGLPVPLLTQLTPPHVPSLFPLEAADTPRVPLLCFQTNIERLKVEQKAQEERHAAVMASLKASCGSWFAEQVSPLRTWPSRPGPAIGIPHRAPIPFLARSALRQPGGYPLRHAAPEPRHRVRRTIL